MDNQKTYTAGETIVAEGTTGNETYLILEGNVLICKETGSKGRIPIATLSEGEVFGEMYLLDDTGFRSASVVAQSAVKLEIISKEEMTTHLAATPPIILSILKTLGARLAQTSQDKALMKYRENTNPLAKLFSLLKT